MGGDAGRVRSAAWRRGGGALHGRGRSVSPATGSRSPTGRGQHRGGRSPGRAWAASGRRDPLAGRGQHRGGRSPAGRGSIGAARSPGRARRQQAADPTGRARRQQAASIGAADPPPGRGSIGAARSPGRAWQQLAADHRQQGGQGLKAAKSSHAKDESPTGILSTHIRVAAEKNFFTPRRGVIWGEKRPFPARGRKPCYDFCVGRESPPAKQKLHSADHGAERISP